MVLSKTKRRIAFIESNTTGTGKLLLEKAIEKNYEIIFLTSNPNQYEFLSQLMINPIIIDTSDKQAILAYLFSVNYIDGVLSSSEYFIEVAAYVASALNHPTNQVSAIQKCRDKAELYTVLTAANINTPKSIVVTGLDHAKSLLDSLQFPIIVKPASGSGSIGVKLCIDKQSYFDHATSLLNITANERGNIIEPKILVQEYIKGDEYSVEVIGLNHGYDILGITKKYLSAEPFFIETGHDFPAMLSETLEQQIKETTLCALNAVGFVFGPAHIELRVYNNEIYIIEINPRLAGGMIPELINKSLEVDVLGLLIDLYSGKSINNKTRFKCYSSIRFIIPGDAGNIKEIKFSKPISEMVGLQTCCLTKSIGDEVTQNGDYRDRIGFVIATGSSIHESSFNAQSALKNIDIVISTATMKKADINNTGRLKKSLHPEALSIINKKISFDNLKLELELLVSIDEAHILMLLRQKIISSKMAMQIFSEIKSLKKNNFEIFRDTKSPRGTYLLYESVLIDKLGMEIGGVIHTGRSRNDINATLFKLSARRLYQNLFQVLWRLRYKILIQAEKLQTVVMPIYSQFQAALPGSYGFYLLAIEEALSRDIDSIKMLRDQLMQSPLGACAGAGTSFPINQEITAKYLGFTHNTINALDAVACRDLALRLLSCLSIIGTTLSRIAQDYQLWTTQEFEFFELPDDLCGSSSMMPQKKNPYLLEKIKGKAVLPIGYLTSALAIMQKTPFGNSVEVGTEALYEFDSSFQAITDAATLLELIISNAKVLEINMENSCKKGLTTSVYVVESLVKSGMPFREAHFKVGETISEALKSNKEPLAAVYTLITDKDQVIELRQVVNTFNYGGGCSSSSVQSQLNVANERLQNDGRWMQDLNKYWDICNKTRLDDIDKVISGKLLK